MTFIGLAIGKFKELKDEKCLINNYFNKATVTETNNLNKTKSAEVNIKSLETSDNFIEKTNTPTITLSKNLLNENDTSHQPSCSKNIDFFRNSASKNTIESNNITQNKLSLNFSKQKLNVKPSEDYAVETNPVKKLNVSSFFLKKLQSVSPIKEFNKDCPVPKFTGVNDKDDKMSSNKTHSENKSKTPHNSLEGKNSSCIGFFCKKIDTSLQTEQEVKKSVIQIENSVIEESNPGDDPFKLLCDKCLKKIDINEYDEHIDHHVAVELSKQLNSIESGNKTSLSVSNLHNSRKRKQGRPKSSSVKKPCNNSIPSYFKPSLNSS